MKFENFNYYRYEQEASAKGFELIAGGDEAGRGPWAGPVFASLVVLPDNCEINGLNDSKKLSRNQRKDLFEVIKLKAICYSCGVVFSDEIDKSNILEATKLAFFRAWENMTQKPDFVLLDYIKLDWLKVPFLAFPKGESISASIAAASIIAKESRDRYMESLAKKYPQYGFERHKGYGTKLHHDALKKYGPCEVHRLSFKPIKALSNNEDNFKSFAS